jgi:hypothetical protein
MTSIDLLGGPNVNDNRLAEFAYESADNKVLAITKLE